MKKLELNRETLTALTNNASEVVGGNAQPFTDSCLCQSFITCPSLIRHCPLCREAPAAE